MASQDIGTRMAESALGKQFVKLYDAHPIATEVGASALGLAIGTVPYILIANAIKKNKKKKEAEQLKAQYANLRNSGV